MSAQPKSRRPLVVLAICVLCAFAFGWLWHNWVVRSEDETFARHWGPINQLEKNASTSLKQAENFAQDWQTLLGRKTLVDDRLMLIGIDKPSYGSDFSDEELAQEPVLRELQGSFPWSRAVWARLIEKLSDAGAKVIALDLVFATEGDGDDQLQQQLEQHRDRVVIGYHINVSETGRGNFRELLLPHPGLMAYDTPEQLVEDDRAGFVSVWPDFDGTLRYAAYRLTSAQAHDVVREDVILESFDARILRKAGLGKLVPPEPGSRMFRYTAPAGEVFKQIPVGDVLSPKGWHANFADGAAFKDKIVMIGPTADLFHDEHDTPFTSPKKMGGPEIHLQLINAALRTEFLTEVPELTALGVIGAAGLIALALSFGIRQPVWRILGILTVAAGEWFFAQAMHDQRGLILPIAAPLMTLLIAGLAVLAYDFVLERLERVKLRHTMGFYFSPRVLEAVLADPGSMEPKRADVTLLLTDLRNSTPLAEALGPQGMFEMLNQVFEVQTKAIMGEEGNLEHFLGDQFLSYWGAPQPQPEGANQAMRAAQKLIAAMEGLRPRFSPEVAKLFGYGVALHSGGVLVGNKGSAQRLDYGLVGDVVNEAARIEALTKYYGAKLLVSSVTFSALKEPGVHRLIDRVIVKGKSEPVELFECANPCTPEDYDGICRRYEMAYAAYVDGGFAAAETLFEALVRGSSDGPSKALAARCAILKADPPADWHGVWKMDAK